MLRFIPPAGCPLPKKHILAAARKLFRQSGTPDSLSPLSKWLGVNHVLGTSSGRAALTLILRGLRSLAPGRDVVAVPAYTCFSVPASVVRAGLRLYPVEIDPKTLDLDLSSLEAVPNDKLLCVITANLFGLVSDVNRIRAIARSKGAFVVDDAAQALGASRDGCLAGTLGDVGFFSFARGKAVASVGGGLVATDSEAIAGAIQREFATVPPASFAESLNVLLAMSAYSSLLHPRLYWFPNSLPFLKLGLTEFDPDFGIGRLAPVAEELIGKVVNDLDQANEARLKRASQMRRALEKASDFELPEPAPDCLPTYIRFPLIARDEETRRRTLVELRESGIGGSSMYPSAICDIPGIQAHMATTDFHRPLAEDLSRRLLTLPTHAYVRDEDVQRMIDILLAKDYKAAARLSTELRPTPNGPLRKSLSK
jgi:perosamine synthetase